jgi:hypothetical protein
LQSFELQERDAYLSFVKSTQELQMYLWKENQEFYEISKLIFPSSSLDEHSGYTDYEFLVQNLESKQLQNHASLEYYFQKQNILESEKRLKWQSFLPKLDFTYNFSIKKITNPIFFLCLIIISIRTETGDSHISETGKSRL